MPHTVSDANVYDESGRLIGEYTPDGKLIAETIYFNDLPIATLRPKGANAGTPLGLSGTTSGNPANGATAANANNAGNNSSTNRVNVEIFYVHPDHLGTPRVVTRSTIATGANAPASTNTTSPGAINKAVWRWDSDPFGTSLGASTPTDNPQVITGTATVIQAATFKQNLRFPGQTNDAESGKYYNYFRDYDSSTGRYVESDPIGIDGGVNTFGYVAQTPLLFIDPTGLAPRPKNGIANVERCTVAIYYGHGLELGSNARWDTLTDDQRRKSDVPFRVKNGPCSSAEVFGCNTGNYVDVETPTPGAANPKESVLGNLIRDYEGLWSRARSEANNICNRECCGCSEVKIYFYNLLPWYQKPSNRRDTVETVKCKK